MDLPYFRMRGLGHGCLFIFILTTVWRAIATLVIHYDDIWPPSLFWSLEIIDLDITLYALMNTPERLRKKCMQRIAELMSLSKGA